MEKRRLGKTGHMSSIITFGGAALWLVSQAEADAGIEMAIQHGINHIDVAPQYGQAEMRLGPWLEKHRKEIFLACKTMSRTKTETWESINLSLKTLRVDHFDLYQFHSVDNLDTLGTILGHGGALEAVLEAKQQGLIHFIGITGHKAKIITEAINRFDFDTVLFPLNRGMAAHPDESNDFDKLLQVTHKQDVGTIAIKAVAKSRWDRPMHMYKTWYEPFEEQNDIDKGLWYTLSHDITTAALPGDLRLWPMVIDAAERFRPMDAQEQAKTISEVKPYPSIFPPDQESR